MAEIKSKVIVPAAIILILGAVWTATLDFRSASVEPGVVTHTKDVSRYVETPVYIEVEKPVLVDRPVEVAKPVYIERKVEVPVEVPVMLRDWDSLEQLEDFLRDDDTDQRIILSADSQGNINFNGQCEDFALQLRDRAMAIGRYLSIQTLDSQEYAKWYGQRLKPNEYHAICMARIGNEFWYIEPQTDKHWLALYLD
jgi:hypothetical protein